MKRRGRKEEMGSPASFGKHKDMTDERSPWTTAAAMHIHARLDAKSKSDQEPALEGAGEGMD